MKTYITLIKMSSLTLLGAMSLLLTVGQASAANRVFPLYLKNGLSYAVTFIETNPIDRTREQSRNSYSKCH